MDFEHLPAETEIIIIRAELTNEMEEATKIQKAEGNCRVCV